MKSIYEECSTLKSDKYVLRKTILEDADDLLEVYSDKNALPFFNSDNCNGDNFYYPTKERMLEAIRFWNMSYDEKWFVRFSIVDIVKDKVIGTIEGFHRDSDDSFDACGVLRVDVGSEYEQKDVLYDIMALILKDAFRLFACDKIITKIPIYAIERMAAAKELGFEKSEKLLKGHQQVYDGYWVIRK